MVMLFRVKAVFYGKTLSFVPWWSESCLRPFHPKNNSPLIFAAWKLLALLEYIHIFFHTLIHWLINLFSQRKYEHSIASRGCQTVSVKNTECIKPSKKEKTTVSGKPSNKVLQQPCVRVFLFYSRMHSQSVGFALIKAALCYLLLCVIGKTLHII